MCNLKQIDALISEFDFKKWREAYRWKHPSRKASENEIYRLENLVRNNILHPGSQSYKSVLLEIRRWKTGRRNEDYFLKNCNSLIKSKVNRVLNLINSNPNEPSYCISAFCELEGVKIPVASAFLRFLDPNKHRFGIIDKYVARFCNNRNLTNFKLRQSDDYVYPGNENEKEYSVFHYCLHQIACKLQQEGITFNNIAGVRQRFNPVDVEMAIFAYQYQTQRSKLCLNHLKF